MFKEYKLPVIRWISCGDNAEQGDYSQQYCIIYLQVAKRVEFKYSHQTPKNHNYVKWWMC